MSAEFAREIRPVLSPTALLAAVGEEACVLDTKSGAYFMLNRAGSFIWNQFRGGLSVDEVHQSMVERFSVASDVLWHDLQQFVESLSRLGLISIESRVGGDRQEA